MESRSDLNTKAYKRAQNPLRREGLIVAIRGTLIAALGGLCLVQVSWLTAAARHIQGMADLVGGVLLLAWGLATVAQGLVRVFQFDRLRYLPASLAFNLNQTQPERTSYVAAELCEALLGRRYLHLPDTWNVLIRGLYSFFPGLLFLMPPLRWAFEDLTEVAAGTIVAFASFALAWFSIATGVAPAGKLFWFHLTMGGLLAYVSVLWLQGLTKPYNPEAPTNSKRIAVMLGVAAAVPLLFWLLPVTGAQYDTTLPIEHLFLLTVVLALLCAGLAAFVIKSRINDDPPVLDPSLLKKTLHESIHPSDIFLLIRRQDPAGTALPHRLYQNYDEGLHEQGGSNRGTFSGELIYESEPTLCELGKHPLLDKARLAATITGEVLTLCAALLLYFGVNQLGTSGLVDVLSDYVSYAFLLWMFGARLSSFAHKFWAEVFFSSYLVYFRAEGSYEQSKVTTGAAREDTLRSENKLVRSKMAVTLVCGRTNTATLARFGTGPLNYLRFLQAIQPAPEIQARIISDIESLLASSRNVAVHGHADVSSLLGIQQFNEAAAQRRNMGGGAEAQQLKDGA